MSQKLSSVAAMASELGVSVPTLKSWLSRLDGMPKPDYTNEKGLQPLWHDGPRDLVIKIARAYMATPRF